MLPEPNHKLDRYRRADWESSPGANWGAFQVQLGPITLNIISSGTADNGWEHVSVSTQYRSPTWDEMHYVKRLFWRDDEVVMQLHPTKAEYVNCHPFCLHMWRPLRATIPIPPSELVGPKVT